MRTNEPRSFGLRRYWLATWLMVALASAALSSAATAQEQKKEKKPPPDPEEVSFVCRDGLVMKATYYPGTEGKETIPVVMLHDEKGNRHEFHELANSLQTRGHAVIVPDLRGHGESTTYENSDRTLSAAKMPREAWHAIYKFDLEEIKKFIVRENNDSKLNVEKTCVVGAGMGAVMAVNWAAIDWSYPPLATGKQGQDILALVLLSPTRQFQSVTLNQAIAHPGVSQRISFLIFVGAQDSRAERDVRGIYNQLQKTHPDLPKSATKEEIAEKKDLYYLEAATVLQGTKLLSGKGLKLVNGASLQVEPAIALFIELRLVRKDIDWSER